MAFRLKMNERYAIVYFASDKARHFYPEGGRINPWDKLELRNVQTICTHLVLCSYFLGACVFCNAFVGAEKNGKGLPRRMAGEQSRK
jgi:hypothetical protein